MVLTKSKVLDASFTAPDFALPEPLTGKTIALGDVRGTKGTLVIFTCVHCPFAIHLQDGFARISGTAKFLYDETQEIARNYGAVCTPDIYLFDADDKLFYQYVYV